MSALIRNSLAGALFIACCCSAELKSTDTMNGCDPAGFRVAIDIGHTPERRGATSARGIPEYRFNRAVALLVRETLRGQGFTSAFVINETGDEITLVARTDAAEARQADVLLSIHHDSVQPHYLQSWTVDGKDQCYSDRFSGFSLFYSAKSPNPEISKVFAGFLGYELLGKDFAPTLHHAEPIKGENRELVDATKGIYRFDDLVVLKTAAMPGVLLECGVIVNREEEVSLQSEEIRKRIAEAVTGAVKSLCMVLGTREAKPAQAEKTNGSGKALGNGPGSARADTW